MAPRCPHHHHGAPARRPIHLLLRASSDTAVTTIGTTRQQVTLFSSPLSPARSVYCILSILSCPGLSNTSQTLPALGPRLGTVIQLPFKHKPLAVIP